MKKKTGGRRAEEEEIGGIRKETARWLWIDLDPSLSLHPPPPPPPTTPFFFHSQRRGLIACMDTPGLDVM